MCPQFSCHIGIHRFLTGLSSSDFLLMKQLVFRNSKQSSSSSLAKEISLTLPLFFSDTCKIPVNIFHIWCAQGNWLLARSLYGKSIYCHSDTLLQLPKCNTAARWLEHTAVGHTMFLNGGHVLHTHIFDKF